MARTERGRSLTRQKVLETALQLIDKEGPEGFNMRKLGATLGVEAMSLYNHIANKEDVLDGVTEILLSQASYPQNSGLTPREELWEFAHTYRDVLRAHPRLLSLVVARRTTEVSLTLLEKLLATLHRANVRGVRAIYAVNSLAGFIFGHAFFDGASTIDTGIERENSDMLAWKRLPPDQYPTLHAAIPVFEQWNPDQEFDFGLEALLQSILPQEQ